LATINSTTATSASNFSTASVKIDLAFCTFFS
jgi:hypothetical protein